jgi:hypothetical protein
MWQRRGKSNGSQICCLSWPWHVALFTARYETSSYTQGSGPSLKLQNVTEGYDLQTSQSALCFVYKMAQRKDASSYSNKTEQKQHSLRWESNYLSQPDFCNATSKYSTYASLHGYFHIINITRNCGIILQVSNILKRSIYPYYTLSTTVIYQ